MKIQMIIKIVRNAQYNANLVLINLIVNHALYSIIQIKTNVNNVQEGFKTVKINILGLNVKG